MSQWQLWKEKRLSQPIIYIERLQNYAHLVVVAIEMTIRITQKATKEAGQSRPVLWCPPEEPALL